MRSTVLVKFSGRDITLPDPAPGALAADAARRWLDEAFLANDCEPLRASGKVLTVDKLLAIAATVGPRRFEDDAAFAAAYAQAAVDSTGRPLVSVDVDAGTVAF